MRTAARSCFLALAFLAGFTGLVRAQEAVVQPVTDTADNQVSLDVIEVESSYIFGSDLHRNGSFGEQDALQTAFSYAHRFHLSGHVYLHVGLAYSRFDFGATGAPVPDRLQSVAAVIGVDYMHNDDVGAFIQIKPGFYTQDDFDGAAFDCPITFGRIWVLKEDHVYMFTGLNAAFLRGRLPVIPLVGIIWEPDKKWRVLAMLPEPRVIYSPNGHWDFWAGGELAGGSFRTDRNNAIVPTRLNGAQVDYAEYRVGAGFVFTPTKHLAVDLGGGYVIQRRFDFYRADVKYKADGAPFVRVEVRAKF